MVKQDEIFIARKHNAAVPRRKQAKRQVEADFLFRRQHFTNGNYTASYSYLANSPLISQISFNSNSATHMTTTKSYDHLNRLRSVSSVASGETLPLSFAYGYNNANQRIRMTLNDGTYWVYDYDALGQVKSGKRYWPDGKPVPGQQFEYSHDTIGNRTSTLAGGDENGVNLRSASYSANSKNQYASRGVPPYVEVLGIAKVDATVYVEQSSSGVYRRGEYFRKELYVNNTGAAQYPTIDVDTDVTSPVSGEKFLPLHPESFSHDTDGNLTQDGRWDYVWDGENRLVKMRSRSGSPATERRVEFEYDWQGRRIRQTVWNDRDDGQGSEVSDTVYLYDGWNLIAELNANSSNARVRTYVWGLDLSGSMQGAGGVGGLLMVIDHTGSTKRHYAAYDGNGNVMGLADSTTGKWSARYEYGPFGEPIRANGDLAYANPMRWSTKYTDGESGLVYYGYRSYNPSTGRWLSRDPIGEQGGVNLFSLAGNEPANDFDPLGLKTYDFKRKTYYREISFQPGDEVIHPDVSLTVGNKVLWPFQEGSGFEKLRCVLANLGFNLPPPKWPVFLAAFNGTGMGWTLKYGIPRKQVTFFDQFAFGSVTKHNAAQGAVTLWHEIKGHQIDDAEDGEAFNTKYEAPIQQAIDKLRADKIYKDNRCAECFTSDGTSWFMEDRFDRILCDCDIPKPRR